jgi:hypothetical protein
MAQEPDSLAFRFAVVLASAVKPVRPRCCVVPAPRHGMRATGAARPAPRVCYPLAGESRLRELA